jgi:hypothetical protein
MSNGRSETKVSDGKMSHGLVSNGQPHRERKNVPQVSQEQQNTRTFGTKLTFLLCKQFRMLKIEEQVGWGIGIER